MSFHTPCFYFVVPKTLKASGINLTLDLKLCENAELGYGVGTGMKVFLTVKVVDVDSEDGRCRASLFKEREVEGEKTR